ncbi:hypothetical protein EV1_030299 [Malus domestica]
MQAPHNTFHLGFFNFSNNGDHNNNIFGVEFDVFENQEFQDPDDNHVGLDINSLMSNAPSTTWYWSGGLDQDFNELKLNNGINYQVNNEEEEEVAAAILQPISFTVAGGLSSLQRYAEKLVFRD